MKKTAQTALPLALLSLFLAAGQMSARPTGDINSPEASHRSATKSLQEAIGYPAQCLQIMGTPEVRLDVTLQKDGKVLIHQLKSDNPFLAQEVRSRLQDFRQKRAEDLRLRIKLQFQ